MGPVTGSWGQQDCPSLQLWGPDRSLLAPAGRLPRRQSQAPFCRCTAAEEEKVFQQERGNAPPAQKEKLPHGDSQALELLESPSSEGFEVQLYKALSSLVLNSVSTLL